MPGIPTASRTVGAATLAVAACIGLVGVGIGVSRADPDGQMYGNPDAAAPTGATSTRKTAA